MDDQGLSTQTQAPTNGANGPGSNMTPTHGVMLVIFGSGALLLALGYIFRK